jgi:hypothetical protein
MIIAYSSTFNMEIYASNVSFRAYFEWGLIRAKQLRGGYTPIYS